MFKISQDAYQGNAQYTVKVDGTQIGGTLTASATRASGQFDTLTVLGEFTPGTHNTEINFLNDAYGGTPDTDRNLFVNSGTYNGATIAFTTKELLGAGPAFISFNDTGGTAPTGPATTTIGAGTDKLVLKVSQDAYKGSAQYTVKVDGTQIGGTLTAQALHGNGQSDTINVLGTFAPGNHTTVINFINDAWDSGIGDRNLWLDGATYNGAAVPNATAYLYGAPPATFAFVDV